MAKALQKPDLTSTDQIHLGHMKRATEVHVYTVYIVLVFLVRSGGCSSVLGPPQHTGGSPRESPT